MCRSAGESSEKPLTRCQLLSPIHLSQGCHLIPSRPVLPPSIHRLHCLDRPSPPLHSRELEQVFAGLGLQRPSQVSSCLSSDEDSVRSPGKEHLGFQRRDSPLATAYERNATHAPASHLVSASKRYVGMKFFSSCSLPILA